MSATIPESHKDLLTSSVFAVLTTLMPDNQPQSSVVWVDYDGTYVTVNTAAGRQKERNMAARPKVSVLAIDTTQPYRWIEVRGEVVEITEKGANAHIDKLASIYTGSPAYYGHLAPVEQRSPRNTRHLQNKANSRLSLWRIARGCNSVCYNTDYLATSSPSGETARRYQFAFLNGN